MNDSTGHESCRTTPDAEDALAAPEIVLSHGHQPNSLSTVGSLSLDIVPPIKNVRSGKTVDRRRGSNIGAGISHGSAVHSIGTGRSTLRRPQDEQRTLYGITKSGSDLKHDVACCPTTPPAPPTAARSLGPASCAAGTLRHQFPGSLPAHRRRSHSWRCDTEARAAAPF